MPFHRRRRSSICIAADGVPIHAVGKICDIYCGHGIVDSIRVADNTEGVEQALQIADGLDHGLVFVNLNDFDSKYGHRRNVRGYADALERLDGMIPAILERIRPGDGLIFTADHGCDPTAPGTITPANTCRSSNTARLPARTSGVIDGMSRVGERMAAILDVASA